MSATATVDVEGYLLSKGMELKRAGGSEVHTTCIFCGEDAQKRGRLYINIDPNADIPGLFHCLAGETEVVTSNGLVPIEKLAGETHRLMTTGGRWVDAPVVHFGRQPLMRVVMTRNGVTQAIDATDEHRWLVRRGSRLVEVLTRDLEPGAKLAYAFGQGCKAVRPSPFGVAHGAVYGDGTRAHAGSCINLHGVKDAELLSYFNGASSVGHDGYTRVTDLPAFFKERPPLGESRSYLYGWLAGYIAADGTVTKDGQVVLWSADMESLRFVEALCLRIGIGTYGVRGPFSRDGQQSKFGDRPLYSISFLRDTITADLLVIAEHRRRFEAALPQYTRKGWVVREAMTTSRVDDVYCAVVADTEAFAIAGNVLTGNCKLCDQRGALVSIKKWFGDATSEREDNTLVRRDILREAAAYYHDRLADNAEALRWLKSERGLTIETIVKHELGWADGGLFHHMRDKGFKTADLLATGLVVERGDRVQDFLRDNVTIPYHVAGSVVLVRGKEIGGKYLTPPGAKTRLFNSDAIWNAEEVTVCEGEFDAMVLEQHGYTAVGAPGANVWQETWDAYFAQTRRVYVMFDPDEAGKVGGGKLRERLSPRSRIIELPVPDGVDPRDVDPTYLLVQRKMALEDFAALYARAGGSLLVTVDEAFRDHQELMSATGTRLGVDYLDQLLYPGLLPGQVMIVLAKTGVGKTIFLLNLFHRMAAVQPELKILFVSLEQTRAEWFERARRIHRFYDLDAEDNDTLDFWRPRLLIVDKNRVAPETFVALLDEYKYEMGSGPDVVAVDYLGYWAQSFKGERYERTSDAVMSLKEIAKDRGTRIIAPHQVSRGTSAGSKPSIDAARDAGVVEETADFLFTLWNPDSQYNKNKKERQSIVNCGLEKSRHGGVGAVQPFRFAPLTLAMVPQDEAGETHLTERALREIDYAFPDDNSKRLTWEEAIAAHQLGSPRLLI